MQALTFVLKFALLAIVLAGIFFFFGDQSRTVISQALKEVAPCRTQTTYRIGKIDKNFHITKQEVINDLASASDIWELGSGRELFKYDPDHGTVVVNFLYDTRQATTEKLKTLGVAVGDDRQTYEAVKARYTSLFADYKAKKQAFESAASAFEARQNSYNAQVQSWNRRGGAPQEVYNQLETQKVSLNADAANLQALQSSLNQEVDDVNELAAELNHLIDSLNLDVAKYNSTGAANGSEFEEAVYESSLGKENINVYEYDSNERLVRVLAHELGHALGLLHVEDPKAIMYKLNQGANSRLASTDKDELKRVCSRW